MTYTDTQLKQALAKMLPNDITVSCDHKWLVWKEPRTVLPVLNTELLHLCRLVEEILDRIKGERYSYYVNMQNDYGLHGAIHATWQQRVIALAKVKGITL